MEYFKSDQLINFDVAKTNLIYDFQFGFCN